jgi:hypothetical protein
MDETLAARGGVVIRSDADADVRFLAYAPCVTPPCHFESRDERFHPLGSRGMTLLPEPPPDIRLVPWFSPHSDVLRGPVEVEAYSADMMVGPKRVRHLRPPATREYHGQRYVVVMDDSDPVAVYRIIPTQPTDPERLLLWPFGEDE